MGTVANAGADRLPPIVGSFPERAEIVDTRSGRSWSRGAIRAEAWRIAARIRDAGIRRGEAVVVGEPDGAAALLDIFGLWTAGAVAIVVHPGLKAEEKERVVAATGARLWLGPDAPAGMGSLRAAGDDAAAGEATPLHLDEPALVLMTSGTTGTPKGIVHTLRSLSARIALNLAFMPAADLARSLNVLPVHFGHGLIGNCLTPLAAGARLHMATGLGPAEFAGFGALIDAERITFMSSVPSFWRVAMRLSPPPRRGLVRVHVGSAPLSSDDWRGIAEWTRTRRVVNMYGMTETANWAAGWNLEDGERGDGCVGRPWGGRVAILADGALAEAGEGEVVVQSPSIMLGYHRQPALTAAAFHGAWFRTGDVGRLGADGVLTLVGRIKDEINRAGMKIAPAEIDMLIARHPDVVDVCAFGVPDPVAGEAVAAAIVLREGAADDLAAIEAWCRERIRAEAAPGRLYALPAIPRTDRGKLSRDAVREAALAAAGKP